MDTSTEVGLVPRRIPPPWNLRLFALVLVLALATITVAVHRIVLLSQDADMINAIAADRSSVTIEQVRALADAEEGIGALMLLLVIALYGAIAGWVRLLNRELAALGEPGWIYRLPAYFAFRLSLIALAAFAFSTFALGRPAEDATPDALIDYDNILSWMAVARIALALCCGWVAVSVLRASNSRFGQLPAFQGPDERPRSW